MDRSLIGRALVVLAAVLASIALVIDFISRKEDDAASAAKERAYLSLKYDGAKITGPYQTVIGGCGRGSSVGAGRRRLGGELIHQRVYLVETSFKAFPVAVCRDKSQPLGYRAE